MKFLAAALCVVMVVSIAQADTVQLITGETLTGKVISQADSKVQFQHPVLGTLTIPADKVANVTAAQPAAPKAVPTPKPEPAPAPKPTGFFADWDARLEVGLGFGDGNSQYLNFNTAFKAKKETKKDRWAFDAAYFLNESDGSRSKDEATIGLQKDWLLPDSPWFYFTNGRFDYDRFASYDQRVSGAGGVGYDWIKTDDLSVTLSAGLGATREFGSDNEDVKPEALLGAKGTWKITDNQTLAAKTTFYPDLGDVGEFRWVNSAEWLIKINQDDGISFKLGAEHEHNSEVDAGVKKNDLKVYAALVWDF